MDFLYLSFVFLLAGFVPELTGFGVSTVMMVLLPFVLPLHVVIPLVALISVIATGIVAFFTKTQNLKKRLLILLSGSVVGVPLGMFFLNETHETILKIVLGVFLIFYSFIGLTVKKPIIPSSTIAGGIMGVVAGFFGSVFNINGPLVGIYSSGDSRLNKSEIKDLVATYMFFTGVFTVAGHWYFGRVTNEVLGDFLFSLPFLFIGLYVGSKVFRKVNTVWVRKLVYSAAFVAGVLLLIR